MNEQATAEPTPDEKDKQIENLTEQVLAARSANAQMQHQMFMLNKEVLELRPLRAQVGALTNEITELKNNGHSAESAQEEPKKRGRKKASEKQEA